jgi:hypothetical protein
MRELHRSAHFVITVDEARRLVRRTRTDRGFESKEEIEDAYEDALKATAHIERTGHVLLVDVRLAPARNDPMFEQIIARYSPRLFDGFARLAILARTEVGKLQIMRLVSTYQQNTRAFTDEGAALAYLLAYPTVRVG